MNTNINITEYDNGVTTICETLNELQSFTLGFWFNTGSRDETKELNGISHFIEHTLFKGTKKRSAKKISDEIEQTGGYLNAFTTKEHTCYYGRGIAGTTAKMFSVLSHPPHITITSRSRSGWKGSAKKLSHLLL